MRPTLVLAALLAPLAVSLTPALADGHGPTTKAGDITVSAWARATPGGVKVGAAYATITSKADDRIIAVSTPAAGRSEIHTHIEEDGVMKMRRIEGLDVKAGKTLTAAPGGDHFMLYDLKAPLKEGETIPLTLTFENAGKVETTADIKAIGARGSSAEDRGSRGSHAGDDDARGSRGSDGGEDDARGSRGSDDGAGKASDTRGSN